MKNKVAIAVALFVAGGSQAMADQQILDDLIVSGSACVGQDCVNGENFGFDTLRLKENNLRLHFDDTSNSASFPNNDWRIVANESNNGGQNKFSIEDATAGRTPFTIEAGARANALYVDDGGRIGFGTSTPVVDVHVKVGDTPELRLEQDGSSGFTPQTWDVAGNEANFFIRDVNNGSQLPFRIKPGADTDSLFIAADNDIGIGTNSPGSQLHIVNEAASSDPGLLVTRNSSFAFLRLEATTASPNTQMDITYTDGGDSGSVRINIVDGDAQELALDHNGNLIVTGTVTTATQTLPDYVFAPDYVLMPIDELAAFVEDNKHLPNVPSAADITDKGGMVNMTELQLTLLEKIEELTLYTLQQEEKIQMLQARLGVLEKTQPLQR